jgi:fructose/tagatose bisphosphate aldolase
MYVTPNQRPFDRTIASADRHPDHYVAMLDRAKEGGFAYPAINVTSSQTLNAALQDGVSHEINEQLYSTVDDARATIKALGAGERGRYLTALTAVASGVVKMNVDTDTQYAFTRSIAGHMISQYDQVLKVDGGFGNKKAYDPRSWGKPAENAMAARVVEAAQMLGSVASSSA